MRILVVGAGGIGGYFGGRLLQAGRDVTFLVRPKRAAELKRTGLAIRSPRGDFDLPAPPIALSDDLRGSFDLILLSCKAYDLQGAADSMAPAVGAATAIVPLLNGMRHLDALDRSFGEGHVLGGLCLISSTLDPEGRIIHLSDFHGVTFGERDGSRSARAEAIATAFSGAFFDSRLSERIVQEMWEKWVFIASMAAITCLMRASVGDIVAGGGAPFAEALVAECAAIARQAGYPPGRETLDRCRTILTAPGSALSTSMLRDIERGARLEADHIVGDLLRRGRAAQVDTPLLAIADAHLRTYEARRTRESAKAL
jgi:2-dehydropantoate 2-reductase